MTDRKRRSKQAKITERGGGGVDTLLLLLRALSLYSRGRFLHEQRGLVRRRRGN